MRELPPCAARADIVVTFGVGSELLTFNADAAGSKDAPRVIRWSESSLSRARIAHSTAEALLTLREREVRDAVGEGFARAFAPRGVPRVRVESDSPIRDFSFSSHQRASMSRGTVAEDEFLSVHEFSRGVTEALRESLASEGEDVDANETSLSLAVWELLEAYFVTQGGGLGVGTDEIVSWYRRNAANLALGEKSASSRLRELLQALRESARPEEEKGYWNMVATMVAIGWSDAAIDLMNMHSAWAEWRLRKTSVRPQVELMEAAIALLQTLPRLGGDEGGAASVPQFVKYRNEWLRQVKSVLAEGGLFNSCWGPTAEGVRAALLVLAGDERAIAANVGNWMELMLAQLQHRYPTLKIHGEHESLAQASKRAKGPLATEALDSLLLSVMAGDAQTVVSVCSRHLDSWFMAYSTTMLSRAGGAQADVLRRPTASGASQSELYMLEYCSALSTSKTTRELAVSLLAACCPLRGAAMISQALMCIAMEEDENETEDDANARAAYNRAVELNLTSTSSKIAHMASERARANGYVALAFDWLRECGDLPATDELARDLARIADVDEGDPSAALARVDAFMAKNGDAALARAPDGEDVTDTCADFYRARATFVDAMRVLRTDDRAGAREAKIAADALVAALSPRSSPPELWHSLIVDAAPLFDGAFKVSALFNADAIRLLSARAAASAFAGADAARALDARSARAPREISLALARQSAAHFALARLTARVAFESS